MTRLPRSHSFVQMMFKAEVEEKRAGSVTPIVLAIRKKAKETYPKLYDEYLTAKRKKQQREAQRPVQERLAEKHAKKIRRYSILKGMKTMSSFGKGIRDL